MANEQITVGRNAPRSNVLFAFAVAIGLYLAYLMRDVLTVIYVSALFAVVLMPLVRSIMKLNIRGWHPGRAIAVLLLLVAIFGGITLFCVFALPPAIHDLRQFVVELPVRAPEFFARMQRLPLLQRINIGALNTKIQDFVGNFAGYLLKSARSWAAGLFSIITGIVLTIYFILEGETAYSWAMSFVPLRKRQRLNHALGQAEVRMGKWLLGQGALMLILGACSTIVFVALHIRYAYALGILMGLFNIIPIIGALITVSLVLLVAAIDSWGRVLGVLIFYTIYVQVENSFLTPRIMQSSVDLAGLAVVIALLLGSSLAGVVGAMVAVPTAVLIAVLLNEYFRDEEPIISEPHPVANL